ncbi:MAG: glycosyltransferase family 2 protein [Minwuia sp.]|uniref:glycosyltransferase family 2 protein n=1 Tax=Minwuia sp. TaxID=2493630 RepID=UPI003A8B0C54
MHDYAVVIPAMNEAGNIGRLVREIHDTLTDRPPREIIVIDDGSDDATPEELRALMAEVPELRVLRHDIRSGQSAAVRSGVRAAASPVIVTMDGDGQNPPADIPKLLAELAGDAQGEPALVNGWRTGRKATGSRRFASRFANAVRQWALKDDCPDSGCGLKAFWRENYLALPFFATMHRFMPATFGLYGRTTAMVEIGDRARDSGTSKYTNWKRALDGVFDLLGFVWLRKRTRNPAATEISR